MSDRISEIDLKSIFHQEFYYTPIQKFPEELGDYYFYLQEHEHEKYPATIIRISDIKIDSLETAGLMMQTYGERYEVGDSIRIVTTLGGRPGQEKPMLLKQLLEDWAKARNSSIYKDYVDELDACMYAKIPEFKLRVMN